MLLATTLLNAGDSTPLIIIIVIVVIVGLVMLLMVISLVVLAVKCTKRSETLEPSVVNNLEAVYDAIPDVAIRKVG
jgi:flagellar basal body-associated protein FliL